MIANHASIQTRECFFFDFIFKSFSTLKEFYRFHFSSNFFDSCCGKHDKKGWYIFFRKGDWGEIHSFYLKGGERDKKG